MSTHADARVDLLEGATPQSSQDYGSATREGDDAVERSIRLQDEALDHLSHGVYNVRNVAGHLYGEVNHQLKMIDGVEAGVNRSRTRVAATNTRVQNSSENVYTFRNFCLLLWPLVLLIVLVFEIIMHFLFRY